MGYFIEMPVHGSSTIRTFLYKDRIQRFCSFLLRKKTRTLPHFTQWKNTLFSFQDIFHRKPICDMQVLHNLQVQLLGFNFSILKAIEGIE